MTSRCLIHWATTWLAPATERASDHRSCLWVSWCQYLFACTHVRFVGSSCGPVELAVPLVDIGTMRNVRPVHQRTPSAAEHELVMGSATPVGRPPGRRTSLSSWRSSPSARNQPPDRPAARGRGRQLHPKRTQAGTMSRAGPRAAAVVAAHHLCSWLPPGWVLKSKSFLRHRLDPSRGGSRRRRGGPAVSQGDVLP
jgi:hypothetical protein